MKEASLDHLMQSLGWTLLHSLWQTALIAAALYVVLAFSQQLSPNVRYILGVAALLFTGLLATTTFLDLYFHHQPALEELHKDIYARGVSAQPFQITYTQTEQTADQSMYAQALQIFDELKSYINHNLQWVVALWMGGVLLLSLRFAGSLFYIFKLKRRLTTTVAEQWQNKMKQMAALLQISQPIKILSSGVAQVPMMIGHLKPVILIPAAMMSGLPEDQLEAIIAHEVAHIYRKDYWINIIQSLFEIIFFFHPAIWWISSVIREEREKCCDDLAIVLCGSSLTYAKALASVEEVKLQHSPLALAMNGGKSSLFQRIERILEPGKSAGNQRARFVSASLAIVIILLLSTSGDSIAYRYGEEKVDEALKWIVLTSSYSRQDTSINLDIENEVDIQLNKDIEFSKDIEIDTDVEVNPEIDVDLDMDDVYTDTFPNTYTSVSAVLARVNYLNDSLMAPAKLATVFVNGQKFTPKVNFVHRVDTFPNFVIVAPSHPDSLHNFNFSFKMDSSAVFDIRGIKALDFDSLSSLMLLSQTLKPALALADSSLRKLQTYSNAYQFHMQDTSIERRLRELEASMREKEREFEKLMREKEEVIQELLREKELEMEEHEEEFEQEMREQERMLEEQMQAHEEQMRMQEEQMEIQEEQMRVQEEMLREQESRFDEANADLEEQLLEDGLIKNGERYTFKLSTEGLFINDKRMAENYYKKYLKWMQENEVFSFEEGSTLSISRKVE
ncbi:M56 family metallopeptidase [Catalinimonas niigatensis]|uniref:M56 family metallopeptidase n=1 Tax=Catalinimonas niigatensis TaxID=1397264 RepID=UPI0026659EE2|nr:M56 family metallopeptidase [Catalinimonas niigatensis]WPP51357.1 M56 family metallopeptidase [Catalinimonas niigatensis]